MNRDQLRAMHLSGTVAVPQKFPELARLSLDACPTRGQEAAMRREFLCAEHVINPKLRIRRWFIVRQVRAVFLPKNPACVNLQEGDWFMGGELLSALPTVLENRGDCPVGIVYVPEAAETLMQVEVGMTAAESVEYYPPLPDDRTVDHYRMTSQSAGPHGAPWPLPSAWSDPCTDDPCSMFAHDPKFRTYDPCSGIQEPSECQTPTQSSKGDFDPCSIRLW